MKENYHYTGNKEDFVKLADVFESFKYGDFWSNMDKRSKRELNKSSFITMISEHYYYRRFYAEVEHVIVDDKRTTGRNILKGFRLVDQQCIDSI